ncbi:DUF4255 domain-containing protein [Chloroflexales bacterium ZM16-3]|nr:DUF4255 domain-containing protein [Chloroflexales bacterium ZM16-3]
MLSHIHSTITALLREGGGLADDVDLVFRAPQRGWPQDLGRTTLCCHLLDLRENTELRRGDPQPARRANGGVQRMPPRMFDLRYVISAFGVGEAAAEQEFALLWQALTAMLKHSPLPLEWQPEPLRRLDLPLQTRLVSDEPGRLLDLWNALGVVPRPALTYTVTAPVELDLAQGPFPPVQQRITQIGAPVIIRGVVRDSTGMPVADAQVRQEQSTDAPARTRAQGSFVLTASTARPMRLVVATESGHTQTFPVAIAPGQREATLTIMIDTDATITRAGE